MCVCVRACVVLVVLAMYVLSEDCCCHRLHVWAGLF